MFLGRNPVSRRLVVLLFLTALVAHPAAHAGISSDLAKPAVAVTDKTDANSSPPHVACDLCKVSGHIVIAVNGLVAVLVLSGEISIPEEPGHAVLAVPDVNSSRAPPIFFS